MPLFDDNQDQPQAVASHPVHDSFYDGLDTVWEDTIGRPNRKPLDTPAPGIVNTVTSTAKGAGAALLHPIDNAREFFGSGEPQPAPADLPSRQPAIDAAKQHNADFPILGPVDRERLIDIEARRLGEPTSNDQQRHANQQAAASTVRDMGFLARRGTDVLQGITGLIGKAYEAATGHNSAGPLAENAQQVNQRDGGLSTVTQFAGGFASPESLATMGLTMGVIGPLVNRLGGEAAAGSIGRFIASRSGGRIGDAAAAKIGSEVVSTFINAAGAVPVSAGASALEGGNVVRNTGEAVATNIALDALFRGGGHILGARSKRAIASKVDRDWAKGPEWFLARLDQLRATPEKELTPANRTLWMEMEKKLAAKTPKPVVAEPNIEDIHPIMSAEQPQQTPVEQPVQAPGQATETQVKPPVERKPYVQQTPDQPPTPENLVDPFSKPIAPIAPVEQPAPRLVPTEHQVHGAIGNTLDKGGDSFLFIKAEDAKAEMKRLNASRSLENKVQFDTAPGGHPILIDPLAPQYERTTVTQESVSPKESSNVKPTTGKATENIPASERKPASVSDTAKTGNVGMAVDDTAAIPEVAKSVAGVVRGKGEAGVTKTRDVVAQEHVKPVAKPDESVSVKHPWEMMKKEYREYVKDAKPEDTGLPLNRTHEKDPRWFGKFVSTNHRLEIETAINDGKTIPSNVLAEYPDLAAKYGNGDVAVASDHPKSDKISQDQPLSTKPATAEPTAEPTTKTTAEATPETERPFSSLNKAGINKEREALYLEQYSPLDRVSRKQQLDKAKSEGLIDKYEELAASIVAKPRPVSASELTALGYGKTSLQNDLKQLAHTIKTETDPVARKNASVLYDRTKAEFEMVADAINLSGTEQARGLQIRDNGFNGDYSFSSLKHQAEIKSGRKLTPTEEATLRGMADKLEAVRKQSDELQNQLPEIHAKNVIEKQTVKIGESIDEIREAIRRLLDAGCANG